MRSLLWFRGKDLRLRDHPALDAARHDELVPVFVLDDYFFSPERARELPHRMQFLLESIDELQQNLRERGSELLLFKGSSLDEIPRLAHTLGCDRVCAMRWSEPFARARDLRIQRRLNVPLELFEGETLAPPGSLRTSGGDPYSVFTPFSRTFRRDVDVDAPLPLPRNLPPLPNLPRLTTSRLPGPKQLGIDPNPSLPKGGETAGRARLKRFLTGAAAYYASGRDRMDQAGTSRLSQDLKFGTVSVRSVWRASLRVLGNSESGRVFTNQLLWREFAHSTLWDRPELLRVPFRREFLEFPWRKDAERWQAWVEGSTGYPIVDAAARQLLAEGFVHNRARMVSAGFLSKHLLIDYRMGEAHYLKYLVDGDWAQNNLGWQWSAGCGCDAQPYFRVFNPVKQGERFDPTGNYVRRWLPELSALPDRYLHAPWTAPARVLEEAGVRLGDDYPEPIVEHGVARERFLQIAASHMAKQRD